MKKRVKDFAYALKVDKDSLLKIAYLINQNESRFYKTWNVPKTDSKGLPRVEKGIALVRELNVPIKKLKYIQSKILNNILYKINLPLYFFGGIKKKDAVLNARYHQGNKFFFLTDLKDFFPSINYSSVELALRKEGFYPDVARLITRLCTKGGAIPQGCPTSSFLSSLVLYHNCGDLFKKYISKGLTVSIYVDDITFSSPIDFKQYTEEILEEIRSRGLKINFDKTNYCTCNPVVTGIIVRNYGIYPMPHNFDYSIDMSRSEASRNGHALWIKYVERIRQDKNV